MHPVAAKIRISSNLLREPHVFDKLGNTEAGLARDLLLWASWKNTMLVQLNVPDFCRLLGYDRRHLLRALTPDQEKVMLEEGFLPKSLDRKEPGNVNSLIAYVITVMYSRTLSFADRGNTSLHQRFENKVMVRGLHVFNKQKKGTVIEFTISEEVLEHARDGYQTIDLADYLSLLTKGKEAKDGKPAKPGVPDDAARKIYWHLLWKRQWWDYLEKSGKLKKGDKPSESFYPDLIAIAGMHNVTPAKNAAHKLRKLLERVSALPSINMEVSMRLNPATSSYEVTWKRNKLTEDGKPTVKPTPFPCDPAPATWGTDPTPPPTMRASRQLPPVAKVTRPSLIPARQAEPYTLTVGNTPSVAPMTKAAAASRRAKLASELEDVRSSVKFFLSDKVKKSYEDKEPGLYEQHLAQAQARQAALELEVNS